jgi:hypothetical protein
MNKKKSQRTQRKRREERAQRKRRERIANSISSGYHAVIPMIARRVTMRANRILVPGIGLLFLFIFSACGGGGTPRPASTTPAGTSASTSSSQHQPATASSDNDFNGTDTRGFLAKWQEVGGDREVIQTALDELTNIETSIMEWHVSKIAQPTEQDEFTMNLDRGAYIIRGFGGTGISDLDMKVFGKENADEPLDADELPDTVPVLTVRLDQPDEVNIVVKPFEYTEGATSAWYAWFIYKEPYFVGSTPTELLSKWRDAGQDTVKIQRAMDQLGADTPIKEWHMSRIAQDADPDEYTIALDAGEWYFVGFGGTGIIDLDMRAYSSSDDELASDTATDNNPILDINLERPETVKLVVEPFSYEDNVKSAWYCWFVY